MNFKKKIGTTALTIAMTANAIPFMSVFADTTAPEVPQASGDHVQNENQRVKPISLAQAKEIFEAAKSKLTSAESMLNSGKAAAAAAVTEDTAAKADLEQKSADLEKVSKDADDTFKNIVNKYQTKLDENAKSFKEASDALETAKAEKDKQDAAYNKAVADLDAAKAELNEVTSANPGIEKMSENLAKIDAIKSKIAELENSKTSSEAKIAQINAEIANLQAAVNVARNAVNTATANLNNAKAELTNSETNLNEKQAAYNNAVEKSQDLANAVDTAKQRVEQSKQKIAAAETELANKRQALADTEAKLAQISTNTQELDNLKADVTRTENDLAAKKSALDVAQAEQARLNNAYSEEITKVNQAQAKVDDAQKIIDNHAARLEQANQNLNAAKARYEAEKAKINDTMYGLANEVNTVTEGFWDSYQPGGDASEYKFGTFDKMMERINTSDNFTKPVDIDDNGTMMSWRTFYNLPQNKAMVKEAFHLKSILGVLNAIDMHNKVRARDGLAPLRISPQAMISAAFANAVNHYDGNHVWFRNKGPKVHGSFAENIAMGYDGYAENYQNSPFYGWYDEEKALYDQGVRDFGRIGHYKNLVGTNQVVGMAGYDDNGVGVGCHSLEFVSQGTYNLTTDEVRLALYNYIKQMAPGSNFVKKMGSFFEGTEPEYITEAKNEINRINQEKTDAENSMVQLKKDVTDAEAVRDRAKADLDSYIENTVKPAIEAAKGAIRDNQAAKKAVNDFIAAHPELAQYDELKDREASLKKQIASFETTIAKENDRLNNLKDDVTAAEAALANSLGAEFVQIKNDLDAANTRHENAKADLEAKTTAYNDAVKAYNDEAAKLDSANKALSDANAEHDLIAGEITTLNGELDTLGNHDDMRPVVNVYRAKKAAFDAANSALTNANVDKIEADAKFENAKNDADAKKATLDATQVKLDEAKAVVRGDASTYGSLDELREAEANVEKAKDAFAKAERRVKAAAKAKEDADAAMPGLDKAYNEALVEYTFAKADYDEWLAKTKAEDAARAKAQAEKARREAASKRAKSKTPKTGDDSGLAGSAALMVGAAAALAAAKRKRREDV